MKTPDHPEESHADDIVEMASYEAPVPLKKDFLPWHRPRKQFVRDTQWAKQIKILLDEVALEDNTLRYLGLPGNDLLDLRFFYDTICQPRNIKLKFLGFNSGAKPNSPSQTDFNISFDEISKHDLVDPSSEVIGDDFCQVANSDSLAWKKTCRIGPYDVINIDLCDGFGKRAPDALADTHYNAVNSLLALQARRKNPWLLLLTTRVGDKHIHQDVLKKLLAKYSQNLAAGEPFLSASLCAFAIEDDATLNEAVITEGGLQSVFLVGLCKWLLALSLDQQPPTTIEVRSVIGYRIERGVEHEDMISIALRFKPTLAPGGDQIGLAAPAPALPREGELATDALHRISEKIDADATLLDSPNLTASLAEATANLLDQARYDVDAYHEWLQANN